MTIIATCIAMAGYNYYLHCQVQSSKRKKKKIIDEDDPFKDANDKRTMSKYNINGNRDSIAASLAQIAGMSASGNFLTAVFSQMWNHMNIAVSNTIKDTLEPTLKDMKVPLHFVKLDLGDVPVRFTNMFIHRVDLDGDSINSGSNTSSTNGKKGNNKQAGIQIDVDVIWDGNCDIMLQATLTKAAKVTFGVKQIKLSGRMHILLSPLTTELPVISAIQYGFTNPPNVQLSFTGAVQSVTSKLGFVQSALISVIQSSLASMLVLPNRMVMPMDLGSYDYLDTYRPPVGMVRLTAESGRGFTMLKKMLLHDIPDIYCVITLGASNTFRPPFRTCTQYDNLNPSWEGESCDFILYDLDQKVYVDVYDEDKGPLDPDDELGKAEITVRDLFRNDGRCELELEMDGEKTGCYVTVAADLFHLAERVQSLNSLEYKGKNQLCGLATIIVTKAFGIPIPKEDAATSVKVVYGEGCDHKKTFFTGTVSDYPGVDAVNPMYNCVFHVPITAAMLRQDRKDPNGALLAASAAMKFKASISSTPKSPESNGRVSSTSHSNSIKSSFSSMAGGLQKGASFRRGSGSANKENRNNIIFTLFDSDGANGTTGRGKLGEMTVSHEELLRAYKHTITATRPIGDGGAQLEFRVILSGMQSEEEKLQWAAADNTRSPQAMDDPFAPAIPSSIYRSLYSGLEDGVTIRVTALRGRGFGIKKRRLGKKDDVPDVYCIIRLNSSKEEKSDPQQLTSTCWKTSVIKDDTMPNWNESRDFHNIDPARDLVIVDVYDENSKSKDEYLGSAQYSLEKLLRKRTLQIELKNGSTLTKSYVTLMCIQLAKTEEKAVEGGEVMVHCHPELGDEGFESTLIKGNKTGDNIEEEDDSDYDDDDDIVTPLVSVSAPPSSQPSRVSTLAPLSDDEDDMSTSSASSTSSISRKMSRVKKFPGKIGNSIRKPFSSKKKKGK
eukprot:CAMPEP_0172318728 /NCGR_PEP_ID=MMETSP1058-20130122/35658_1 /TAXON_ID=83371 /ORGANISM="Detonula confervacea, Strain CCMP 353" /LENGTH=947 /DNA_ID=CAMNT_0013033619 /DNA_START=273 /DNA_END=3116 /DNA_ORIENTATION=+